MLRLALRNLLRRPVRLALALAGVAIAAGTVASLASFGAGYRQGLATELQRSGMQLMLVPLGCPYDAAARVLKGRTLDDSLPAAVAPAVRADPAVAVAAPLLMVAVPRAAEKRTDLWVGLDHAAFELKPWWRAQAGRADFPTADSVILGANAAVTEARQPGDKFYCPEANAVFRVAGVLQPSGTSDDNLFFLPLATAQRVFGQVGRLTAVAVRLRDPALLREASARLQRIRGAQVATMTEMMGTFLNLVGAVRTLLMAIGLVAAVASALGVFNTLLAAVVERADELCLLRALGASRAQVFGLITLEAGALGAAGATAGLAAARWGGAALEGFVKQFLPLPPAGSLMALRAPLATEVLLVALAASLLAGLYPAWRAIRLPPARATRPE